MVDTRGNSKIVSSGYDSVALLPIFILEVVNATAVLQLQLASQNKKNFLIRSLPSNFITKYYDNTIICNACLHSCPPSSTML